MRLNLSRFSLCSHPNAGPDRPSTAFKKWVVFRRSYCRGEDRGDFQPLSRNLPETKGGDDDVAYIFHISVTCHVLHAVTSTSDL